VLTVLDSLLSLGASLLPSSKHPAGLVLPQQMDIYKPVDDYILTAKRFLISETRAMSRLPPSPSTDDAPDDRAGTLTPLQSWRDGLQDHSHNSTSRHARQGVSQRAGMAAPAALPPTAPLIRLTIRLVYP